MALEAWTDERLDDLATALRPLPGEVARISGTLDRVTVELSDIRSEMREMRTEMRTEIREMRSELHGEMTALRGDFGAQQRQLAQIGWAMVGTLIAGIVAVIVAFA